MHVHSLWVSGRFRLRARQLLVANVVVAGLALIMITLWFGPSGAAKITRPLVSNVITTNHAGVCKVPIEQHYNRNINSTQVRCAEWSNRTRQLVTLRNMSGVAMYVNDTYVNTDSHGEVTIHPGQTVTLPLWAPAFPFSGSLYVGACWPGQVGPGTCSGKGPPRHFANLVIERWAEIPENTYQLWFRTSDKEQVPESAGSIVAINDNSYPVEISALHWNDGKWVTLPPKGRSQPIPAYVGRTIRGKKPWNAGGWHATAVVTLAPTGGGHAETYLILNQGVSGPGSPPQATMTWLAGGWCSVGLQNIGGNAVVLNTWYFPGPPVAGQSGPGIALQPGSSGTLTMHRGTVAIAGQAGGGLQGQFTVVKATDWKQYP